MTKEKRLFSDERSMEATELIRFAVEVKSMQRKTNCKIQVKVKAKNLQLRLSLQIKGIPLEDAIRKIAGSTLWN